MGEKLSFKQYRKMVEKQAQSMLDALAFAATGDLNVQVEIPEGIDVLTDLAIGFSYLIDDLRDLLSEQAKARTELENRVAERTQELETALQQLQSMQRRYVQEQWRDYTTADFFSDTSQPWLPAMSEAVQAKQTVRHANGGNQAALAVPIRYSDELIGVLGFGADESLAWADEDITAVEAVVEQVGLALENQRLFDQTQSALAETEALYQASAELSRTQTYEELLTVMRRHTLLGEESPLASLSYFDRPWTSVQQPEWVEILARYSQEKVAEMPSRYKLAQVIAPDSTLLRQDAPTIIEDVANDARLSEPMRHLLQQAKAASALFIPLVVSGQWMGFIHAIYDKPTQFDDIEMRRLMLLTGQAAVVAQTIRLLEETQSLLESEQRQRRIADTLVQAAARMTGILDEQEIHHILIDEINGLIRPDQISLYEWSEKEQGLRLNQRIMADENHAEDEYEIEQFIAAPERPDLWRVLTNNQPFLEAAKQTDEYYREHYCLPWLVGGKVAGVVEAYHTARYLAIRDVDQRAAEDIVRQADLRIQNARLFAQSQLRAEELTVLNEMGRTLTVTRNVDEVVELIYAYTNRLMDAENFYVALYHPRANEITFPLAREEGEEIELLSRPFGEGATEYVIQSGQPLLVTNGVAKWLEEHGFNAAGAVAQSWLGVPLRIGNEVFGAIAARSSDSNIYDVNHQNLLTAISGQAAIAVQNARLFAQTQDQLANLTTIQQTTSDLTAAPNLQRAVDALLPRLAQSVNADFANAYFVGDGYISRAGTYPPIASGDETNIALMPDHLFVQQVVDTRQALTVTATDDNLDEQAQQAFAATGIQATATVPLRSQEGILGTLAVSSRQPGRIFTADEVNLLQTLADQATIAFERVRLLEEAERRARREQLLREITGRVRSSADVDTIMKTAVQEIGRALGRETFIRLAAE